MARRIGMGEIMTYYNPKSLVVVSFLFTLGAGAVYPVYGYVYAEALF